MTRREEIENNIGYKITKAAMEYYQTNCTNDVDLSDAFEEGAEWMQKTMIEKACEWLKFNTNWGDEWNDMGRNLNYGMIEEFRKAMEE